VTQLLLDPVSGIAGDMFVGALLDLGASFEALRVGLESLQLDGVTVSREPVDRGPLRATLFRVDLGPHPEHHPHRTLRDVRDVLARGDLPERVRRRADAAFELLAHAEAKVHGKTVDTIHFHEVGALDAICDVVGVCLALENLNVAQVHVGTLPLGSGQVHTEHGLLPVPAPATLECLTGFDLHFGGGEMELVTPTGAALVASLCDGPGLPSRLRVRRIGYGAGTRDRPDVPNVLRAVLADDPDPGDEGAVVELATNVDHLAPTVLARASERMLEAGALDVTIVPATMKKGRPGHVFTVLVPADRAAVVEQLLFAETGTLGVRRRAVTRSVLARESLEVATAYGAVHVKCGRSGDTLTSAVPEFEECRALADAADVPITWVIEAATAAALHLRSTGPAVRDGDSSPDSVPSAS
jgi:uncharacterized protein (TIGR00299 family) protein